MRVNQVYDINSQSYVIRLQRSEVRRLFHSVQMWAKTRMYRYRIRNATGTVNAMTFFVEHASIVECFWVFVKKTNIQLFTRQRERELPRDYACLNEATFFSFQELHK